MGDYAYFQLYVYEVPADKEEAFNALLAEHGVQREFEEENPGPLGEWIEEEARLDIVENISTALSEMGVSFQCWQDPKYEYDGTYAAFFPGLGLYQGSCNAYGEPYLRTTEIAHLIDSHVSTEENDVSDDDIFELPDALLMASGQAWVRRAYELQHGDGI